MRNLQKIIKSKWFNFLQYLMYISITILLLVIMGKYSKINKFVESVELKTLDFRFSINNQIRKHNPNIAILTIDEDSLQLLENEFGNWPWTRNAYTEAINYMELGKVDSVAFDLMFLGYQKGNESLDKKLIKTLQKYKNVAVSFNFDNNDNRNPNNLPDVLKYNIENKSKKVNFENVTFSNYRPIINEIIETVPNIASVNYLRDDDGNSRHCPTFFKYKNDYYPYLGLKVAANYLHKHENLDISKFIINKNNELVLGKKKFQLNSDGLMLLNWYGPDKTFEYIPFWKVIKSANDLKKGKSPAIPPEYFKNKIIFLGVTATSMYDIKSTPLSNIYPGVEIHATLLNNIIDGHTIKRLGSNLNFGICALLSIIVGCIIFKLRSTLISTMLSIIISISYILLSFYLLKEFYLWIDIVNPAIFSIATFISMYIVKYIIKSRDYEYTYKLATTDGLTNLYNHRYFQEALLQTIGKCTKFENEFSLILIDIDHFKKFNDTYGHQAGDIVLKRVAEILKKSVKSTDLVARYGGEEMVIILYKTNLDKAVCVANRICKKIAQKKFKLSEELEVEVTISLGVSTFPEHGATPAELIEFSDKGLYRAKLNGRNQVGEIPGYISKCIPDEIKK